MISRAISCNQLKRIYLDSFLHVFYKSGMAANSERFVQRDANQLKFESRHPGLLFSPEYNQGVLIRVGVGNFSKIK